MTASPRERQFNPKSARAGEVPSGISVTVGFAGGAS